MNDETVIEVDNLHYQYEDGRKALDGIGFSVTAGESVGLVGPNGAGKTTLFLCLCGVHRTSRGQVKVKGLDPAVAGERRRLPSEVGIVFQNSDDQIFHATVFDDVAFGLLNLGKPVEEIESRVATALEKVGLPANDRRVPFHLSGGEKRRVAIAGVLAMSPSILLLDEPSMYLDPRGRKGLCQLLNELTVTKLIATHDLEFVLQVCSRVIVMDSGKIYANGLPQQVLADAELLDTHGLEVPYSLR